MATKSPPRATPSWFKIAPFFASAIFFLSYIFSVFAPLPLLIYGVRAPFRLLVSAVFVNAGVVTLAGGWSRGLIYLSVVGVLTIALVFFFYQKKWKIERAVAAGIASVLAFSGALVGIAISRMGWIEFQNLVTAWVSQGVELSLQGASKSEYNPEDLEAAVYQQGLSIFAVSIMVMAWANLVLVLRLNAFDVRRKLKISLTLLKKWKAPEFLVWLAIAGAAAVILDQGWTAVVGINIINFMMAVYAIQGFSVLSFIFDRFKIRGLLRSIGFVFAIWPMMPMTIGMGFFDLWFDFRSKLRQS